MRIITAMVAICIMSASFFGCATMLKGYEDEVELKNASDSLVITDSEGIKIPIATVVESSKISGEKRTMKYIQLRSNKEHRLILKDRSNERAIVVYPKLGFGWVTLDLLMAGVPTIYDAYTGCWNKFSPIDASL